MTSIAQGKRSDTLGKPQRHATPCKGKSKHNMLCFSTFALAGRKLYGTLIPRVSLRLPWAMNFCPFGTCRLASYISTDALRSACEESVLSAAPTARSVFMASPHGICVDLCDLWVPSLICLFKRIVRLVFFTPTDLTDFHRCNLLARYILPAKDPCYLPRRRRDLCV